MSDKFKKFLKNQQKEINDLAGNNNLNSENNEINYDQYKEKEDMDPNKVSLKNIYSAINKYI